MPQSFGKVTVSAAVCGDAADEHGTVTQGNVHAERSHFVTHVGGNGKSVAGVNGVFAESAAVFVAAEGGIFDGKPRKGIA